MKGKQNIITLSRYLSTVCFVLVQLGILIFAFLFFQKYFAYFYLFCGLLSLLSVLYIVR